MCSLSLSGECLMLSQLLVCALWHKPFGVKGRYMVGIALLDTVRELRYWFTGNNSCPWGIILLLLVVISCGCCIVGFILGALAFSVKIRQFAIQVLQLFCSFLGAFSSTSCSPKGSFS